MQDISTLLKEMDSTKCRIDKLKVDHRPGVYSVFLNPRAKLYIDESPMVGLIYLGMSRDLAAREFDLHFESGGSGFSTLRRSLGAILKRDLNLRALPRGTGSVNSNYTCYKFTVEGEEKLSEWMCQNLEISSLPIDQYEEVERQMILVAKPVLCLKDWKNPNAAHVKHLRQICTDEARQNRK